MPLIESTLSSALGIGVTLSFSLSSEDANAVMSPPTKSASSIPTPPTTVNAPVDLLVELVFEPTSRVPAQTTASVVELPRSQLPSTDNLVPTHHAS